MKMARLVEFPVSGLAAFGHYLGQTRSGLMVTTNQFHKSSAHRPLVSQADFSPEDLYTRKRSIESKDNSGVSGVVLPHEICQKLSSTRSKEIHDESILDSEVENIVGLADSSQLELLIQVCKALGFPSSNSHPSLLSINTASFSLFLQEMIPPETLCELRPDQKQALHLMMQMEKGRCLEEAATTLYPCFYAYRLADKWEPVVYLNAFSGDATTELPSTFKLQEPECWGLGKTIMTIALLLTHPGKGASSTTYDSQTRRVTNDANHISDQSSNVLRNQNAYLILTSH